MNENENFSDVVSDVDDEMYDLMKEGSYNNVHKFGQHPTDFQRKPNINPIELYWTCI